VNGFFYPRINADSFYFFQTMLQRDESYAIIGAAMEVHRELRNGFLEVVYGDALAVEFTQRGIPFAREVPLPIFYKGGKLPSTYKADFICYENVLVETKALARLTSIEEAQVLNYLKITRYSLALLLNFGAKSLEHRRLVLTPSSPPASPPNLR
jgi:GxxExxY protein